MPERDVEAILSRLIPAAPGETATARMETTLEELAARDFPGAGKRFPFGKTIAAGGIAALLALGFSFFPQPQTVSRPVAWTGTADDIVLLNASERVEEMSDEGWQEQQDGSAMHAVRVSLIGEKDVRDEETGIVMRISQPREEWILTPVDSF